MALTTYVVLRQSGPQPESNLSWDLHAEHVEAVSGEEAIKQEADGAGTYVAVPARSWKPASVKVETKKVVSLG